MRPGAKRIVTARHYYVIQRYHIKDVRKFKERYAYDRKNRFWWPKAGWVIEAPPPPVVIAPPLELKDYVIRFDIRDEYET